MAITHIATASAAGGSSSATTGSVDSTGADLAVIFSARLAFAGVTFSDSKGNTYTALTSVRHSIFDHSLAYCLNPTVGSGHTFTTSGASEPSVECELFGGVDAYDQESGFGGATLTPQPGSITPPEDGCLFVTGLNADNNSSWSINSSFTLAASINSSPGTYAGSASAYKIQTTAGAENPTWTATGNANTVTTMATFTPTAGGGGGGFIDNTTPILRHIFGMAG